VTYHGEFVILSILDWLRCIIGVLNLLAKPHSSIPYVHIGLIIVLYKSTLLSSDMMDLYPMIQYKSFTFKSICFLFLAICCCHVSLESKWIPRYLTVDDCGSAVLFRYNDGHFPFFSVKVTCNYLVSLCLYATFLAKFPDGLDGFVISLRQ
jgi:phosphatidylserine synthase